MKDCVQIYTP